MDELLRGFLEGALWAENDDNGEPFDGNYDIEDFSKDAIKQAESIVSAFKNKVEKAFGMPYDELARKARSEVTSMGVDLWLTLVGHGAGFWDGDWDGPWGEWGDKLTEVTKSLGHMESIYVGDDGLLYLI